MKRPVTLGLLFILLLGMSALAKERGPGTLTVTCDPPAVVRVDGKRVGLTPLRRHALRAGRQFQVIVHAGKETNLT